MLVNEDCILLLKPLVLACLSPVQAEQLYFKSFYMGAPFVLVVVVHKFGFSIVNMVSAGWRCTACSLSAVQNFMLWLVVYV